LFSHAGIPPSQYTLAKTVTRESPPSTISKISPAVNPTSKALAAAASRLASGGRRPSFAFEDHVFMAFSVAGSVFSLTFKAGENIDE
jgi:hypothetical protein